MMIIIRDLDFCFITNTNSHTLLNEPVFNAAEWTLAVLRTRRELKKGLALYETFVYLQQLINL